MGNWVQIKKAELRTHFCTGLLHSVEKLSAGLPGCLCPANLPSALFLPSGQPSGRFPGTPFQPLGLKLSPSKRNCAVLTNQSGSILTKRTVSLDQLHREDSHPHLHETDPSGTRTSVPVSPLPSGWGRFSNRDCALCVPVSDGHAVRLFHSSAALSQAALRQVKSSHPNLEIPVGTELVLRTFRGHPSCTSPFTEHSNPHPN